MTTIAADRECMAGDSRYDDCGLRGKARAKIFKISGDLVGFAGSMAEGLAFCEWYKDKERDRPDIGDTTILVLKADGTLLTYDSCYYQLVITDYDYYAIGSGQHFAMGAMMAGKSPPDAVRIAAKLDTHSGPPVKVLRL